MHSAEVLIWFATFSSPLVEHAREDLKKRTQGERWKEVEMNVFRVASEISYLCEQKQDKKYRQTL